MSYQIYFLIHLVALFWFVGTVNQAIAAPERIPKKKAMMLTGIAMFFVLLGGFGMLARLGIAGGLPGWAIGKLVIWFVLAGSPMIIYRMPEFRFKLRFVLLFLMAVAVYLVAYKPF